MLSSRHAVLVIAAVFAMCSSLRAERAPLSAERKDQESTHIVTGEVLGVYRRDASSNLYGTGTVIEQMIVEISVSNVEKGNGIAPNDIIYARCWKLKRTGDVPLSPGPGGHFEIPEAGAHVRVFLAKGQYSPTGQDDRGYAVLYPNGFEVR
jgi:hypothetical protein